MLNVICSDELDAAKEFAKTIDALENLERQLETLTKIGTNLKADEVVITKDFAEHGFCWSVVRDGDCIYNGGLLLSMPGSWGGGPPNFSVDIDPPTKPEWRIHS